MSNACGYLGIAQRARKIVSGEILWKKFSQRDIQLIVISDDIGDNAKKKLMDKCAFYQVSYVYMDAKDMASVMGNRKAVGILDQGLAQQLQSCLKG